MQTCLQSEPEFLQAGDPLVFDKDHALDQHPQEQPQSSDHESLPEPSDFALRLMLFYFAMRIERHARYARHLIRTDERYR